jgi:hypothetical protein
VTTEDEAAATRAVLAGMDGYTLRVAMTVASIVSDLTPKEQRKIARYVALRFGKGTRHDVD